MGTDTTPQAAEADRAHSQGETNSKAFQLEEIPKKENTETEKSGDHLHELMDEEDSEKRRERR